MRSLRSIVAVAALSLSLPVLAVPTTTAYDFNAGSTSGTTLSSGGPITTIATGSGGGSASDGSYNGLWNGTYFGNTATYKSGSLTTTVSAWASTGGGTTVGPNTAGTVLNTATVNGTIQNAVLTSYSTNNGTTNMNPATGMSLAETSRNTAVNQEFTCPTGNSCSAYAPNHAVDNSGAYETLLFSFSSAVTLSTVTLGYPSVDTGSTNGVNNFDASSDLTILYCKAVNTALCATSTFAGQTFAQLVASGNGQIWGYTDLFNLSSTNDTASVGVNINSQYWMVGAYIADLPNQTGNDGNPDYVKIRGLTVCTTTGSGGTTTGCAVPEPSSIALFGIAAGALWVGRRRRQLRVA